MFAVAGSFKIDDAVRTVTDQIQVLADTRDGFPLHRRGGYLCVTRRTDGRMLLIASIGVFPQEKAERYFRFCQEKASRLLAHEGHISSWQTRDEKLDQYGGAIVAGKYILSFSGLPELADELIMMGLAQTAGLISPAEARAIAEISQNPYYLNRI